jgi:hypothetical protein
MSRAEQRTLVMPYRWHEHVPFYDDKIFIWLMPVSVSEIMCSQL